MKRLLYIILTICLSVGMEATTFEDANAKYTEGDYATAATLYQQILDSAVASHQVLTKDFAPVYYNLGNALFRQEELAQAILAYERCLRLDPNMKDAQYNLQFAQSRITDNIADTHDFFLRTWAINLRNSLDENTWMWLSIAAFILFLTSAVLFALTRETWLKKTSFYLGILALIISISACCNAASLHNRDTKRTEAIITQVIIARASPDRSGTELFTIHEGTKVIIHECIGEWCNIQVGNNEGWIKLDHLERI